MVTKSVWFPTDAYNAIQQSATSSHIQNVLDARRQFTRELASSEMQAAYDEIKAQTSKLT